MDLYNNKLARGMGGGSANAKFGSYPKPNLVVSCLNCDGMGEAYWCPLGPLWYNQAMNPNNDMKGALRSKENLFLEAMKGNKFQDR